MSSSDRGASLAASNYCSFARVSKPNYCSSQYSPGQRGSQGRVWRRRPQEISQSAFISLSCSLSPSLALNRLTRVLVCSVPSCKQTNNDSTNKHTVSLRDSKRTGAYNAKLIVSLLSLPCVFNVFWVNIRQREEMGGSCQHISHSLFR